MPELTARIRSVLRRRDPRREGPRRVGELFIDPSRREVRVGDRQVRLANKEFSLLRMLAADPTRVFTKEELLRDVWGFRTAASTPTGTSRSSTRSVTARLR
jgi:DNA-binding response OmpR family regulator